MKDKKEKKEKLPREYKIDDEALKKELTDLFNQYLGGTEKLKIGFYGKRYSKKIFDLKLPTSYLKLEHELNLIVGINVEAYNLFCEDEAALDIKMRELSSMIEIDYETSKITLNSSNNMLSKTLIDKFGLEKTNNVSVLEQGILEHLKDN